MSDSHHEAGPEHRLERLVFFSDAVFAIAITLLVIELHPPHLHSGASLAEQVGSLGHLLPEIGGFLISFFAIGAFWGGHHRIFSLAGQWDDRLYLANIRFLLAIVAMPFVTAFMSANSFALLPVVLYAAWLLLAAAMNILVQRVVLAPPVVHPAASPRDVLLSRRRGLGVALGSASALLGCLLSPIPAAGLALLVTMPLWRMLLERLDLPRSAAPQPQADQPA